MKPCATELHWPQAKRLARRAVCVIAVLVATMAVPLPAARAADGAAPLLAYGARVAGDDARTRLVIEFDRSPEFSIHYVANPVRVIIDLPETSFGLKPESLEPRGLFDAIRYGGMGEGASRLVLPVT